jgi:hypothetical protein
MPTRLEVLLQSRKSAAAGADHRQRMRMPSAGKRPAVLTRGETGGGGKESDFVI